MTNGTTVVAFHAHPDDEVLWTGGTLARLAAAGHRVVIAVATDGHLGAGRDARAKVRLDELAASARTLGVARTVHLGYADSGHGPILYPDPADRPRFVRADLDEAAGRLADVLRGEHAGLLISYDPRGGYGHRDHVRVHQVGARAAELAGGLPVLEATLPRETGRTAAADPGPGPVGRLPRPAADVHPAARHLLPGGRAVGGGAETGRPDRPHGRRWAGAARRRG